MLSDEYVSSQSAWRSANLNEREMRLCQEYEKHGWMTDREMYKTVLPEIAIGSAKQTVSRLVKNGILLVSAHSVICETTGMEVRKCKISPCIELVTNADFADEVVRLRKALDSLRMDHYHNYDDPFYSCPSHPKYKGNEDDNTYCNCGCNDVNKIIDDALAFREQGA
jgi:hypothetical protein